MGITGNLKTMALAELLQWLSQGQKTGTLVVENDKIEKKVFFEKGFIISSASTDNREYLGNFLVSHGYLTEEQVDAAVARQKEEKKLIGKILVELAAIPEDDLQQMLRLKAEESIYDIFTWGEGDFRFLDGELPELTMVPMNLDVQWLVLEGMRRVDELNRIREQVPSSRCVAVSVSDLSVIEDIEEADLRILSFVDDDSTVEEISQSSQTSVFLVSQALATQVSAGTVKLVRPREIEVRVEVEVPAEPTVIQAPMPAMTYAPPVGYPPASYAQPSASTLGPPPRQAPPARPRTEADEVIEQAKLALDRGDLEGALKSFRRAPDAEGGDQREIVTAVERGIENVHTAIERDGVNLTAVPRLSCSMERLTQLDISPQEGFMLTRVNGSYDIKSLLKMHPASKLDTQLLFWRLRKSGHVAV